jgi:hypothetical protein
MESIDSANDSAYDVLFWLTDNLTRKSEGPRGNGELYQVRFAVTALTHSWAITEIRSTGTTTHHAFATSLADLCLIFKSIADVDICRGVELSRDELSKRTKRPAPQFDVANKTVADCISYLQQLDSEYLTDYALHDDVRKRFFNTTDVE